MNNQFLYINYERKTIGGKEFLCINVLEYYSKKVYTIYKTANIDELISKLNTFDKLDNINDYLGFAIKRDGKISLDIKL